MRWVGGSPASPGVPMVMRSSPSGENLSTAWPVVVATARPRVGVAAAALVGPAVEHIHPVGVDPHRERAALVPRLLGGHLTVPGVLLPGPRQPFQPRGGDRLRVFQKCRFGLGRGDPGEGADLGMGKLPAPHGFGGEGQFFQLVRDADVLAGGRQRAAGPPGQRAPVTYKISGVIAASQDGPGWKNPGRNEFNGVAGPPASVLGPAAAPGGHSGGDPGARGSGKPRTVHMKMGLRTRDPGQAARPSSAVGRSAACVSHSDMPASRVLPRRRVSLGFR